MKNFTSNLNALFVALFAVLYGVQGVRAEGFPKVEELYGRYTFSGEFIGEFMEQVDETTMVPVDCPFATTGYEMAVVPGGNENEVQLLGFFGMGGGVTLTYNPEDGTLKGAMPDVCFMMSGTSQLVASGNWPDYPEGMPENVEFNYSISQDGDGAIIIKSDKALENVQYMDMMMGVMGTASYSAGYTLTKSGVSYGLSDVTGMYEFKAASVDILTSTYPDASDVFDLKVDVVAGEDDMVELDNWFGVPDTKVKAKFYADGGLLVLPHDVKLANGMYFGQQPAEEGGYNPNPAPFFFVQEGKLVSYSYFNLFAGMDEVMGMELRYTVIGGEAVKKTGESVGAYRAGQTRIFAGDGEIRVENIGNGRIYVFDAQGISVASAQGETVEFNGLKAGLYIVKAGERTVKILVK